MLFHFYLRIYFSFATSERNYVLHGLLESRCKEKVYKLLLAYNGMKFHRAEVRAKGLKQERRKVKSRTSYWYQS